MSYKNGVKYIKLRSLYEGYVDEDIIVAAANESVSDITKYHIIVDGRIVETISEDDTAEDEFSNSRINKIKNIIICGLRLLNIEKNII